MHLNAAFGGGALSGTAGELLRHHNWVTGGRVHGGVRRGFKEEQVGDSRQWRAEMEH